MTVVSIVTISYNHQKYIRNCLEGLISQKTKYPFEIIIHDDASTDSTQSIISEYYEKYPQIIKPILQKENKYSKGISILGIIIPYISGKYIAICEGDDSWIIQNKLEIQIDYMESHPECSMCFTRAKTIDIGKNKILPLFSNIEEGDYTSIDFIKKWIVPTASIIIRRDVFLQYINIRNKIRGGWAGDRILELCAARMGTCHCIPITSVQYNLHSEGASKLWNNPIKQLEQYKTEIRIFPELKKELSLHYDILVLPQLTAPAFRQKQGNLISFFIYLKFIFVCPRYGFKVLFRYILYKIHILSDKEWPNIV